MIKLFSEFSQHVLKFTEINDHIFMRAFVPKLFLSKIGHDTPTMPMQILAFAMIISKKVGSIKATFGF